MKIGFKMSRIMYIDDSGLSRDVKCSNCCFSGDVKGVSSFQKDSPKYLHCKIKALLFDQDIIVYQQNNFREFTWKIHLIESETIVVKENFGCVEFKPKK